MSDGTSSAQPGWYHAPGDAEGTQRYWDGERWVGEPQRAGGGLDAPAGATAGASSSAPAGYQPYGEASGTRTPAEWGPRAVAYLIDVALLFAVMIVAVVLAAIVATASEGLAAAVAVVGYLAALGVGIWNLFVRQGGTGQSIGKSQRGISLVKDETGAPVGAGMAFVRYLLAGALSSVTCGVYGLLDVLWPLWDDENKRLTDKILKMSVVVGDAG